MLNPNMPVAKLEFAFLTLKMTKKGTVIEFHCGIGKFQYITGVTLICILTVIKSPNFTQM